MKQKWWYIIGAVCLLGIYILATKSAPVVIHHRVTKHSSAVVATTLPVVSEQVEHEVQYKHHHKNSDDNFLFFVDGCLSSLLIDGTPVVAANIPYCDEDRPRVITVQSNPNIPVHTLTATIIHQISRSVKGKTEIVGVASPVRSLIGWLLIFLAVGASIIFKWGNVISTRVVSNRYAIRFFLHSFFLCWLVVGSWIYFTKITDQKWLFFAGGFFVVGATTLAWCYTKTPTWYVRSQLVIQVSFIVGMIVGFVCVVSPQTRYVGIFTLFMTGLFAVRNACFRFEHDVLALVIPRFKPRASQIQLFLVLALSLVSTAGLAYQAIMRHRAFMSAGFDLGIQENLLWNLNVGNGWLSGVMVNIHYLSNHTPLIYLPLSYLYSVALYKTGSLLAFQSFMVSIAAIPLYLIARKNLGHTLWAFTVPIAYLIHPAVQGATLFDFHELCFLPFFYMMIVWSFSEHKIKTGLCFTFLALLVKEDVGLLIAPLGVYYLFKNRTSSSSSSSSAGFALIVIAGCTLTFLSYVMIPLFGGISRSYAFYFNARPQSFNSALDLVQQIITDPIKLLRYSLTPEKFKTLFLFFAGVGLLPLFNVQWLLLGWYPFLLYVFATSSGFQTLGFHYFFLIVGPLAVGAIHGLRQIALIKCEWMQKILRYSALGLIIVTNLRYGFPFMTVAAHVGFDEIRFPYTDVGKTSKYLAIQSVDGLIPRDSCVITEENLVPHLSRRNTVLAITRANADWQESCAWRVYDIESEYWLTHEKELSQLFSNRRYVGRFVILHRKSPKDSIL